MWALPVQLRFDKWQSQIDAQYTYHHDSADTNANADAYESQSHFHSHSSERRSLLNHSQTRRRYSFLPFLVVSTLFLALLCTTSLLLSHSFPVAVSSKTLRLWRFWLFGSPSLDYQVASAAASPADTPTLLNSSIVPTDTSVTATWENLKAGEHCLRYATREYTARLQVQVSDDSFPELPEPQAQDMLKLCRETPVRIHGRERWTSFCQDLGFGRGVWGFWVVDFEEPDCETTWGEFRDLVSMPISFVAVVPSNIFAQGCTPSLTDESQDQTVVRRFSSHLENLQTGSNWQIMCTTTPADIEGHHFSTPLDCYRLARLGTYGVWDVADSSCDELD
ncbi:hypothetical protein CVT26_013959 [Gymnopilus dilepis]|uniref:Uncharacterized protein n=1 Tax=Gymnopilus dilepis TaxID=231916 RepID=A0A409WDW6_9AGAR|nr:hypothetical protein CVT26_013959 [Gymnopilus dilepis]